MLDGTIVNVALPSIERDLGGGLSAQQWVANAYLLSLGSLILIGGSLGDIYGERRIFTLGVAVFGVFSVACALAPTIEVLIAARALQGAAGALLTPSALAIIVAAFPTGQRAAAIGSWTAWGGIAALVGPLLGGVIVDQPPGAGCSRSTCSRWQPRWCSCSRRFRRRHASRAEGGRRRRAALHARARWASSSR